MKKFKVILLLAAILMGWNAANAMTAAERAAQTEVASYLTRQGFKVEIDKDDESVNFKQSDILYWITFSGDSSGVLYTLHRRPIKLRSEKDDAAKALRKNEVAVFACNEVNRRYPYKAVVKDCRVDFTFPVYAATPAEYIKELANVLNSMRNIKQEFDRQFEAVKVTTDSIHNYWATEKPNVIVLPQSSTQSIHKVSADVNISKVAVASYNSPSMNESNKPVVDYDHQLDESNCLFLRERITLSAREPGKYYIGVKILNPEGKLIVPNKDDEFTTVTPIEVKKANKEVEYELRPFGTAGLGFWKAGNYTLEFYDADVLVRSVVVTVQK